MSSHTAAAAHTAELLGLVAVLLAFGTGALAVAVAEKIARRRAHVRRRRELDRLIEEWRQARARGAGAIITVREPITAEEAERIAQRWAADPHRTTAHPFAGFYGPQA